MFIAGRCWVEGIPPPTPHTQWRPGPRRAAGWYLSEYLAQHLLISLQLIYTALHCQLWARVSTHFITLQLISILTVMAVNVFNTSVTNENLSRYHFDCCIFEGNINMVNLDMKCCPGWTAISSHTLLRLRNWDLEQHTASWLTCCFLVIIHYLQLTISKEINLLLFYT